MTNKKILSVLVASALGLSACAPSVTYNPSAARSYGGGGGSSSPVHEFRNEWADSSLVDERGVVEVQPNETVVEHPSTDPEDFGFNGDGPPSIDS